MNWKLKIKDKANRIAEKYLPGFKHNEDLRDEILGLVDEQIQKHNFIDVVSYTINGNNLLLQEHWRDYNCFTTPAYEAGGHTSNLEYGLKGATTITLRFNPTGQEFKFVSLTSLLNVVQGLYDDLKDVSKEDMSVYANSRLGKVIASAKAILEPYFPTGENGLKTRNSQTDKKFINQ